MKPRRGITMRTHFLITAVIFMFSVPLPGQTADTAALKSGVNFIETETYSQEENQALLKLYEDLRVADVSDGMDYVGLPNTGLVDPAIHPDWRDLDSLTHVIHGIALTVRYVPTQRPPSPESGESFSEWEGEFYSQYSSEAFTKIIREGHVIMIDDVEEADIGSIGSFNSLAWTEAGAVGIVTDASARDTDEIAKQGIPLYLREKGRGIRPGRNELESVNRPIVIGGVLVRPGDVVVADGDGVIVVPRDVAREVAEYAHGVLESDKQGRRELYKRLDMDPDQTVE